MATLEEQGFDSELAALFASVRPFTMTSPERVYALAQSVRYVVKNAIEGDIVECGVWRGGSMMAVAQTLMKVAAARSLHLFDTFDGMPMPSERDMDVHGRPAAVMMAAADKATSEVWAVSSLDEVRKNMTSTGYDASRINYIPGRVEDTIPRHAPEQIALLRLDTDWYESTYHEMKHLFPRLSVGGVLIIDDYGHWRGARQAVDQYLAETRVKLLLTRIDYTCRLAVKVE